MTVIRRGDAGDLPQVAAIQDACPEAPHWNTAEYLNYDLLVAICQDRVAGFLASRTLVQGEREILNLAVAPEFRRQGIAREMCKAFLEGSRGTVFLEVRETNQTARNLYLSLGFQELGRRPEYYDEPLEAAIVMKFHSC
jgi:ribosomal-protein-alanine acetyltransferase